MLYTFSQSAERIPCAVREVGIGRVPTTANTGTKSMRYLWLVILLVSPIGQAFGDSAPLRVFASVLPIQTFVEQVGGEHVEARAMVRPGFSPHTYDPTPQQIAALARAALYVRVGVPFEDAWMGRIRSANSSMQVIDVRSGLELRVSEDHEHAHDHGREVDEFDPHVWTNPRLVMHMIGRIRDRLAELDPAHAADFSRNHDAYLADLRALDEEIHELLDPLRNRKFMVFHPAWGYFADAYGLVQVPIEHEGKEPGARALAALIDRAKAEGVRVIFVQPQFDKRQATQIARAIGGSVIAVDPLAPDYVDNLRQVARQFAAALQP